MRDFWLSCGHHLLDRDVGGGLLVTDEFLKAYFARPELAPPPEAGDAERALHAALLADPRRRVSARDIAAMEDPDARENWEFMIGFRKYLLEYPTLEAAYFALIRANGQTPPIFLNQLVHAILRNMLDGCEDAVILRAAELFFRPQILTLHNGSLLAADEETIAGTSGTPVSPLVSMLGLPTTAEIDIIGTDNVSDYFERSDRFDMALDLTAGRPGLAALGEVMVRWVRHMLGIEVIIEPLLELRDARFTWYVGLDTEGTRIGDMLWNGETLDKATLGRIAGLYRLFFREPSRATLPADEPVYLILAMTNERILRFKPQNLLTGLPVHLEVVS
jgi:hypothetical protein